MGDYWSEYWSAGHLSSFGDAEDGLGYDNNVRNHWWLITKDLKPDQTLVDIGCGNGAIWEMINPLGFLGGYEGIDQADLSIPCNSIEEKNCYFHSGISATEMPFDSLSVYKVVSQFGFEYCPLQETVKEIKRVLMPGGVCSFVCHIPESVIVQRNQRLRMMLSKMQQAGGLFDTLARLVKIWGSNPQAIMQIRQEMNHQARLLADTDMEAFGDSGFPALAYQLLSNPTGRQQAKKVVADYLEGISGHCHRLDDLLTAVVTKERLSEITAVFDKASMCMEKDVHLTSEEGLVIGSCLTIRNIK
ncbi:class I SAM-dependent methyltransferase [Gallaecimonas sp. GXIMD1310]|uniref:class I SAM-dependent methyltransferase n=1 Tax=Gallaecimonas sp. GXIMD1310 TaxID=3131926 RepID=UPI00324A3D6A